jgi:hypothetical protein
MTCTTWHDHLIDRLYDEIGDEADAALSAHLETCAGCREGLEEFRRLRIRLQDDAADVPRVPRVVVLRDRWRLRPALLAASLLGAAVLAGAGAGAGYALGRNRSPAPSVVASDGSESSAVATEDLVRREVDRRFAALEASRTVAGAARPEGSTTESPGGRAVSPAELRAEFAKFERRMNGARAADLDYVLDQIAASEYRVGARLGKTNQALRSVALASTPYANEQ